MKKKCFLIKKFLSMYKDTYEDQVTKIEVEDGKVNVC